MPKFANPNKITRYADPKWEGNEGLDLAYDEPVSFITLRTDKGREDDRMIADMVSESYTEPIDPKELRRLRRLGDLDKIEELYMAAQKTRTRMSIQVASIKHMAVKEPDQAAPWVGPEFCFDDDYEDENGEISPLAGTPAPFTVENIAARGDMIDEVFSHMSKVWAGAVRTPDQQKTFRVPRRSVSGSAQGQTPREGAEGGERRATRDRTLQVVPDDEPVAPQPQFPAG